MDNGKCRKNQLSIMQADQNRSRLSGVNRFGKTHFDINFFEREVSDDKRNDQSGNQKGENQKKQIVARIPG